MKVRNQLIIYFGCIVALIGGIYIASRPPKTGNLDAFATCLKDKGVTFYGAFWCPHCQAQKKLFGSSASLLPYVECSTPDGQGLTQICKDKEIKGYPTWVFADGSRQSGEMSLADLADKSGCSVPSPSP